MISEIVKLDLPDVKDIPGQENIIPAPFGEMADETISSADEEGNELFDDDIDEEIDENPDSNVTAAEKEDLEDAGEAFIGVGKASIKKLMFGDIFDVYFSYKLNFCGELFVRNTTRTR